jgi:penicillin amidase
MLADNRMVRRTLLRGLVAVLALVILAAAAAALFARHQLQGSLAVLDGARRLEGLEAEVSVERDALGVPTLSGSSRTDVARALGFIHAQDRFFQMDLQRRQPAGELAGLVGSRAFDIDAQSRVHRFRRVAAEAYARSDPEWKELLDAYASGVNAGLAQLAAPPFEYLMLRADPVPWKPEDSILTILAMFVSLQGRQAQFEQTNQQLRAAFPEAMFRFLADAGSAWDAPAVGDPVARPPVPGPDVIDLRSRHREAPRPQRAASATTTAVDSGCRAAVFNLCLEPSSESAATIGSNNWAVDAAHSADGGALLANDMHLGLGVPNIWYRVAMTLPDPGDPLQTLRLAGVTLPGLPVLVVGSNGSVAWGFTNTGGDWSDLVRIDRDPRDATRYLTPDGAIAFEVSDEAIAIKDAPARSVSVRSTIWGPIVWTDHQGRDYAQHWLAHDPDVLSSDLSRPERVRTIDEMLVAVAGLGMPNQNVAVADRAGRIAWTVGGALPRRRGFDGFTAESWADGTRGWDGYLANSEFPKIVDPERGRIWTANAPVVDGAMLGLIGDGGYSDGIRARIIRDRLLAIDKATPRQMLALQLDNTALFLERWRTLLLATLAAPGTATPAAQQARRDELRRLVETTWTGQASPDSAAYLLVRTFRAEVVRSVLTFVTAPARDQDPAFDYSRSMRTEGPVWDLVSAKPLHLLDPRFPSWAALLLEAADTTIAGLTVDGAALADRTWGQVNRARILHPLASAVPLIHRWLNMPDDPLPGDVYTPRAHSPGTGPSERMVVSPGREEQGILHMPTGQSAHPLSPYFGTMHRAWLNGDVVPLLPGAATHTLTLTP